MKEICREQNPGKSGTLFLVATPIGNLGDLTERAIRILNEVDLIAAEDTRHTRKLLTHLSIRKPIISYYREKEREQAEKLLAYLHEGKNIALVSDAGTPGLSDPGTLLVQKVVEKGTSVVPVPGPSACVLALIASGLSTERFVFEGFLPRKKKLRISRFKLLVTEERTIIIYEAPHRLLETLKELQTYLGKNRRIVVARELTKLYEEFWRGTLEEAVKIWGEREIKGEFTLVIEGIKQELLESKDEKEDYYYFYQEIIKRVKKGEKPSALIREIARRENISRSGLYQYYLGKTENGK